MTISDSLPIQFWLNGQDTFNETDVCGLAKQDCFCSPFECTDAITLQFQDSAYTSYSLIVLDENGAIIDDYQFFEIASHVWEMAFSNESRCNQKIALEIVSTALTSRILAPSLSWSNFSATHFTTKSATSLSFTAIAGPQVPTAYQLLAVPDGQTITFDVVVTVTGTFDPGSIFFTLKLWNGDPFSGPNHFVAEYISEDPISVGIHTYTITLTANSGYNADRIICSFAVASTPTTGSVSITFPVGQIVYASNASILLRSDCLDIKTTQDCTKLISYTNSSNFDGIDYSDLSPGRVFYLRIPATFYEESNPQEQEDMELSNGQIVTIRQGIQQKKKLDIGYMPPYMHLKVQKVLMHETVTIDGTQWRRRDPYNAPNIPKYNLKKGDVLLTKYNSVEKNTI